MLVSPAWCCISFSTVIALRSSRLRTSIGLSPLPPALAKRGQRSMRTVEGGSLSE